MIQSTRAHQVSPEKDVLDETSRVVLPIKESILQLLVVLTASTAVRVTMGKLSICTIAATVAAFVPYPAISEELSNADSGNAQQLLGQPAEPLIKTGSQGGITTEQAIVDPSGNVTVPGLGGMRFDANGDIWDSEGRKIYDGATRQWATGVLKAPQEPESASAQRECEDFETLEQVTLVFCSWKQDGNWNVSLLARNNSAVAKQVEVSCTPPGTQMEQVIVGEYAAGVEGGVSESTLTSSEDRPRPYCKLSSVTAAVADKRTGKPPSEEQ